MESLYSLYDALVAIDVPNDKALAVVEAIQRDFANTLATRGDLQLVRQEVLATRGDVQVLRQEMQVFRQDVQALRQDATSMAGTLLATRGDIDLLRKDMQLLESRLTVKLGVMIAAGFTCLVPYWKYLPG